MSEGIQVGGKKFFSSNEDLSYQISSRNQDESFGYEEKISDSLLSYERCYKLSSEYSFDDEVFIYPNPNHIRNNPHTMSRLLKYFFKLQNQDQSFLSVENITETAIDSWKLNLEWLKSCVSYLSNSIHGFDDLSDAEKGKLIIERLLFSDLKLSCAAVGVLPKNVDTLHNVTLPGPFVLQVNEIVDVCITPKDKFLDLPYGLRCLKLSMTDGVQCVTGMEQRSIKDLQVASPVGLKVLIHDVNVRHGSLMLVPEGLKVLGGVEDPSVEEIDDATCVWRCKKQKKKTFQEPKEKEVSNAEADGEEAIRGLVSFIIYGKAVPYLDDDDEMKVSDLELLEKELIMCD